MINWHLVFIAITFFGTMIHLSDFVHSLRYLDVSNRGGWLALFATALFLLIAGPEF